MLMPVKLKTDKESHSCTVHFLTQIIGKEKMNQHKNLHPWSGLSATITMKMTIWMIYYKF